MVIKGGSKEQHLAEVVESTDSADENCGLQFQLETY